MSDSDVDELKHNKSGSFPASILQLPQFAVVRKSNSTSTKSTDDYILLESNSTQEDVERIIESRVLPSSYYKRTGRVPSTTQTTICNADILHRKEYTTPLILICGHGSRDSRCGIMGPVLRQQFQQTCRDHGISASCRLITHIGGHKFAGNVIIYVPPTLEFRGNALAGMGIWYGRVEPLHVPGIIQETLQHGRIIQELYRGSMKAIEDQEKGENWTS